MKTYKAKPNNKAKGVFSISLVEDPAMEGHFVVLSKEKEIQLKTLNEEKRLLIGLVLEPNKPIYRNQGGEEFYLKFDEPTILELSHSFFKNKFQLNSTLEHTTPIDGVAFVESWIVEDSKIDKSALFGFSYPKGSWLATMKVDNDEVWNDYVKTGKVKGFSIDAFIDLEEEINLKKENMSNTIVEAINNLGDNIKVWLTKKEAEVKLGSIKSGDITIEFDGEALMLGEPAWMTNKEGERVPVPIGSHPLENGQTLVVTEVGYVGSIEEGDTPAEPQEMNDDAQAAEIANAIKSVLIKYSSEMDAKIQTVIDANVELKKELDSTKEELVKLSNEPATKKIPSAPVQVDFSKMSEFEKRKYYRKNG